MQDCCLKTFGEAGFDLVRGQHEALDFGSA